MLVIPKQLAVNAAQDATDIVAKLRSNHNAAQSAGNTDPDLKRSGLDCISGKIQNNLAAGIIEPALSKVKMAPSHLRTPPYIPLPPLHI